jgi:hypothetical protein
MRKLLFNQLRYSHEWKMTRAGENKERLQGILHKTS